MTFSSPASAGSPDPHLTALTVRQADHLRDLVGRYHADRGEQVTVEGDTVRAPQGTAALYNLAEYVRRADPRDWPRIVEHHFAALASARESASVPAAPDDVLRRAFLRLIPDDALPPEAAASFGYVRPVATGLSEALALDLPDSVRLLDDRDVAAIGLEALRTAGRANLLSEPAEHETVPMQGGGLLHVLSGESPFVASKALVLDEVVRAVTGRPLPAAGALFTVPSRSFLVFHPLADHHVQDAVNDLAAFGLGAHGDNPGPLSPRLYWWHRGAVTNLTRIDEATRSMSIEPPAELMDVMRSLVAAAPGAGPA
ncbi:hypothetical protein ACFVGY_01045 [Streptomyces sp. NPDC127106]|uniref:hypothetical protein n=1 Tax=Streptomyces sp. NPDC127106 TaxID=3345360 RepID=UPI0036438D5B